MTVGELKRLLNDVDNNIDVIIQNDHDVEIIDSLKLSSKSYFKKNDDGCLIKQPRDCMIIYSTNEYDV